MKYYNDIDLRLNKLQNVILDPLTADPADLLQLKEGRIWYNMEFDEFRYFDGREVQILGNRKYVEDLLSSYDSTIEVEIQQVKDDHVADINNLHNEILSNRAELEAIISQLSSDMSGQQEAAISILEAKHDQDVADIGARIDGVISTHNADKEELLGKIDEEKAEVLAVVSNLDQSLKAYCDSKIEEVNLELEATNEELAAANTNITRLSAELTALGNDVSDLSTDLNDKIDNLDNKIDENIEELISLVNSGNMNLNETKLEIKLCSRGEYDPDHVLVRLFEMKEGTEVPVNDPTSNYLYVLRANDTDTSTNSDNPNYYNEYIWVEGGYELIGSTDIRLDKLNIDDIDAIWEDAFTPLV